MASEIAVREGPIFTVTKRERARRWLRILAKKRLMTLGLIFFGVICLAAVLADVVTPYHYSSTDTFHILEGPSRTHWFGTDSIGADTFSRVVYASRLALAVGLGVSLTGAVIALAVALSSAMFRGSYDLFIQRVVDAWMCLPNLVIILTTVAVFGPGLFTVVIILGFNSGFNSTRVLRSSALRELGSLYVEAAESIGATKFRIAVRHLLPNVMPVVIVLSSTSFAFAILAEAGLSFLGYGVPPPFPSWGGMLGGQARDFMYAQPWLGVFPGIALSLTVWSVNLIGDGLRDLLDPRLRGQGLN